LLEFDSCQIGVQGWELRGEISKAGGLASLSPLLLHRYLPPILLQPGWLTTARLQQYLPWTI